ncbi:MAG TPA: NADH-quinone oxidoreductase subunit A [Myxococcota bacterium]|nr:NADH-quinone oxidoreductase subunit A [Myxococcota bacterium]HRY92726.1 NADH-quinone oxidoreductase subunit A [Myxococcota bacterium]HSA23489.1 NADH-quinone oxidoreductase subunit A [Myxococcota bacterium]
MLASPNWTHLAAELSGEAPLDLSAGLSLLLYTGLVVGLVLLLMLLAAKLGHKSTTPAKREPYESGILPSGEARVRGPVPFYLVAVFFIVFDVEAVFIVSWAVVYDRLGWAGFAQMAVFIGVLFLALGYLWKAGALDWGPRAGRKAGGKLPEAGR